MDGSTYPGASRLPILPHGAMPSVYGDPPDWSPVRYRGISPRPTALRVVLDMPAPVLRRLNGFHPIKQSLAAQLSRLEQIVFDLRCSAEAVRAGDARWSQRNAETMLGKLRQIRRSHSEAIRAARDLAKADERRARQ